jgi:hypothetical protein
LGADPFNEEHRLLTYLFNPERYDTDVFPKKNLSGKVTVDLGFAAVSLVDLDEQRQVLHMYGWLRMVRHNVKSRRT